MLQRSVERYFSRSRALTNDLVNLIRSRSTPRSTQIVHFLDPVRWLTELISS